MPLAAPALTRAARRAGESDTESDSSLEDDQPRSEGSLAGRAAPGGGAGSRDVPMPGGARPPRLAAGRLHHAPPAPGIARGAAHMLRLCVSHVKAGRHLLSVPYSKCFKSATGCCLRPPGWQAAGLVCSCRARYRPAALERVHAWLCLRPL
jgi:hypothetical protein